MEDYDKYKQFNFPMGAFIKYMNPLINCWHAIWQLWIWHLYSEPLVLVNSEFVWLNKWDGAKY